MGGILWNTAPFLGFGAFSCLIGMILLSDPSVDLFSFCGKMSCENEKIIVQWMSALEMRNTWKGDLDGAGDNKNTRQGDGAWTGDFRAVCCFDCSGGLY